MTTMNTDTIQPGDEIRVGGSRRWLRVVEVLPAGVHVRGDWHAWHRWHVVAAHRFQEGGRS